MDKIKVGRTDEGAFKYLGVNIKQSKGSLILNQEDYVSALQPIEIPKERLNRKYDSLSRRELEKYRALIGQMNWLSTQSRPDVAFSVCDLSKKTDSLTVDSIIRANKIVKMVKSEEVSLHFRPLQDVKSLKIECYSDASYANLRDGGSQGGYLIFVSDEQNNRSLVSWQSRRVRRVVKSTLAAEALALLDAAQAGVLMAHMISEILSLENSPIVNCYVDNRSLVESLHSTKSVDDKHLRIDVAVLKDMMHQKKINAVVWVDSFNQLANVLTKAGCSAAQLIAAI